MNNERKILVSILVFVALSALIAVADISMNLSPGGRPELSVPSFSGGPGIGIVRINGPIDMSGDMGAFGGVSVSESVVNRLSELESDSSVKAIVLRINSPGGTIAATQEIYEKIWKIRKNNIPVVASLGDIAASGGYYAASASNVIVANYGTITGSIGVIAASPDLQKLFDKLGIKMNVIKSGRYKDIFSSYRDMSAEELEILQGLIDSSYRKFLKDVAQGRSLGQDEIAPYADGRIMDGPEALKCKLVDMIGTFEDAVNSARELAGLPADCPVYDHPRNPFQDLMKSLSSAAAPHEVIMKELRQSGAILEYRYRP